MLFVEEEGQPSRGKKRGRRSGIERGITGDVGTRQRLCNTLNASKGFVSQEITRIVAVLPILASFTNERVRLKNAAGRVEAWTRRSRKIDFLFKSKIFYQSIAITNYIEKKEKRSKISIER